MTLGMQLQDPQQQAQAICSVVYFFGLCRVSTDPKSSRLVLMMAVDLLQEFIQHAWVGPVGTLEEEEHESTKQHPAPNCIPGAQAIMIHIPKAVLECLTDLLYAPCLGPDSLEYIDPVHNIVTRASTLKLLMGYDALVDHDGRVRPLEVLVPLLELDSPTLAGYLGTTCPHTTGDNNNHRPQLRLYDAFLPILTTQIGRNKVPLTLVF